jgi:murein DD-endopeptidase MepM/ murein hydrolase activator NlpD
MVLILAILLLAGGFRGVLAQPSQTNRGGDYVTLQQLQPTDESDSTLNAYASIPAMPVVVHRASSDTAAMPPPSSETMTNTSYLARSEIILYLVKEGDTLNTIAGEYNLSAETIYWYNELKNANVLAIGQELLLPPTDGLIHIVGEGDDLDDIAEEYGVRKGNMIAYQPNKLLEPYTLKEGQEVFVPGAAKPIPQPAVSQGYKPASVRLSAPNYAALPGGERFSWPAWGRVTDRFGWTGSRWHNGLDIAAPWGTPVYAAAAGTVTFSGWKGSLGYLVAIDHGEGWVTRYGHMAQQPDVAVGQWVERGQLIGYIGCTGWCTGPHVHFEIRYQGNYTDPLNYLQ